ncbi:MAG: inositol monophosphatase family protein [Gammaproteobacteria bacterium]
MHPMLNIAERAARTAGNVILRSIDRIDSLHIDEKSRNDFATEVDHRAEQEIIRVIRNAYPDHTIIAEESGVHAGNDFTWIIDPLDGTTNFLHGFPQYAVSIALARKGRIEQAVVYDPLRQELFSASRGTGAMLNNRRLRVSGQASLKGALLGTGFPFGAQKHLEAYLNMFRCLSRDAAGIRRPGSAALDLACVAAGRFDGFWEIGLRQWDMAAGVLLVQEAGGIVTDFAKGNDYLSSGNIIAANPKLHSIIQESIAPFLTEGLC